MPNLESYILIKITHTNKNVIKITNVILRGTLTNIIILVDVVNYMVVFT